MQFIMKPSIDLNTYEIAFFDTQKDPIDFSLLSNVSRISIALQDARTFMGSDGYLNPVRGKSADGKYYLTFLRWSFYGYDNKTDYRMLGQHYLDNHTTVSRRPTLWTSKAKADGSIEQNYPYGQGYNVITPVPTVFTLPQANVIINLPKYKLRNYNGYAISLFYSYWAFSIVRPTASSNYNLQSYGYNSQTAVVVPAVSDSDYLYPNSANSFTVGTQYLNAPTDVTPISSSGFNISANGESDGLLYLADPANSTSVSSIQSEEIDLDVGLVWPDATTLLKLSKTDWDLSTPIVPGSRPKLRLNTTHAISLNS